MKAVVLAGGFGTRIQPLTANLPKPMLPVVTYPMLENVLINLDRIGVDEVFLLLYFMPEKIREYFEDHWCGQATLHYIIPDSDYGTAGSVAFAADSIEETFAVISGDLVTDIDLKKVVDFHRRRKAMATMALTSVPNALQFGVVIADEKGRVRSFLEKPGWGEVVSDTINTGIYILEPEVLKHIPRGRSFDFSRDLFPELLKKKKPIFGFDAKGYWRDVGNPDSYRTVHRDIFAGKTRVTFPGRRVETGGGIVWLGEGSKVSTRARIHGTVVVGRDVKLPRGTYTDTVIGDECEIAPGCRIQASILWTGVTVGHNCHVNNAVLCDNVRLGDGVSVKEGAVIASGTIIEDGVSMERDILLWPGKLVEAGSVLSSNLIWGDRWKASLFEGDTVSGYTNEEMSPVFTAKLGEAFGSVLKSGESILVSRDYHKASRMLKRSFLGGVLSTGVSVHDLRLNPIPVTRFKLTSFGEVAGVHFRQKPGDETSTEMLFFDAQGYEMGEDWGKDIERIFFRESFRRSHYNDVGTILEVPLALDYYREHFLKSVDRERVRRRAFKVVLDLAHGSTAGILPEIMSDLNCETVVLNAHADETRLASSPVLIRSSLKQVGKIVKSLGADMGFYVAPSGERMFMVDDRGRPQEDHRTLLFLLLLLGIQSEGRPRSYLPAQAPLAAAGRIEGVQVDSGRISRLERKQFARYDLIADLNGRYSFTGLHPHCDAMYAIAVTLQLLAGMDVKVSALYDALPEYGFVHSTFVCPPDMKGRVMRNFRESVQGLELSYSDGIKALLPEGSILLLPDDYGPQISFFTETDHPQTAQRLASRWGRRIRRWILQR
ncbi:MAG: NTP transferase domain-containing protein [bacterium]|nr:MAG: NTP transferase domain-containing protein [bacterium]